MTQMDLPLTPDGNHSESSSLPESEARTSAECIAEDLSEAPPSCAHDEPIAIVGIGKRLIATVQTNTNDTAGCRLPGDISSASDLWEFLKVGRDGHSDVPKSRFNIDAYYNSKPNRPGSLTMRGGYFIDQDLQEFDNSFFSINNLEATHMDPQQRILLEVVYECFESAGARLDSIAGSNVGCFVGNFTVDFQIMQARDWEYPHRYTATGVGTTILSNRISHVFDLRGPSMTLDTACSSSLYCLHFACRSLARGDCDSAVVAAANLIQAPEQFMGTAAAGVLSDTSTCHSFATDADGYGRADAIGALYLKRLSDALRDNDPIRSVIRSTAVNANGRTPGITLPSSDGQEAVVRQAYNYAGVLPKDTQYVECHGTGTPVGDPIEISALASFFTKNLSIDEKHDPLLVGSVKSNLGHSEAASGITSIIKATLALEHLQIPPTVGIKELNSRIPWRQHGIDVVRSLLPWPVLSGSQVPRVSVNSFGYGGANSHCILERAESQQETSGKMLAQLQRPTTHLVPVSAKSAQALQLRVNDLVSLNFSYADLPDLAYTLAERRTPFDWRCFLAVDQKATEKSGRLEFFRSEIRQSHGNNDVPLCFVFTGQGAQWPQMGKELIERSPAFCKSIMHLQECLSQLPQPPSWSLSQAILRPPMESSIHDPLVSQTACTAIQIALVDLLRSWGVFPAFVMGHSSGEIAAAYTSGHISSFDAIAAAYIRGLVVQTGTLEGAMIVVGMSSREAQGWIDSQNMSQEVSVACINSPESVTLSGDVSAIDTMLGLLQHQGKFARKLKTGGKAYHSHHMKHLGAAYESKLAEMQHVSSKLPQNVAGQRTDMIRKETLMISSVYCEPMLPGFTHWSGYWRANLESPVNFSKAVESLLGDQDVQFVEIGPHGALEMPIKQTNSSLQRPREISYLSAMTRNTDSERCVVSLVGNLWTLGYPTDFGKINGDSLHSSSSRRPKVLSNLPNYPWDHRQKLWKEPRASSEFRHRGFARDDLLGSLVPGTNRLTHTWRNFVSTTEVPWLRDHKLADDVVFPAAAYITIASRAAQQLAGFDATQCVLEIRNMHIMKAMVLPPEAQVEMFTELATKKFTDLDESCFWWHFTVSTVDSGRSIKHASGDVGFVPGEEALKPTGPLLLNRSEPQHHRIWYSQFAKQGLKFGPNFWSISEVHIPQMRNKMAAQVLLVDLPVAVKDPHTVYDFDLHPVTIDAQLQAGLISSSAGNLEHLEAKIPVFLELVQLWPQSQSISLPNCVVLASSEDVGFGVSLMQSEMMNPARNTVLKLHNVKATRFQGALTDIPVRYPMLDVQWQPDISKLSRYNASAFARCIELYMRELQNSPDKVSRSSLGIVLRLLSHQGTELKLLDVGCYDRSVISELMDSLDSETPFQRFKTYHYGSIDKQDRLSWCELSRSQLPEGPPELQYYDAEDRFDIILCTDASSLDLTLNKSAAWIRHLKEGGKLLFNGDAEASVLTGLGFQTVKISASSTIPVTLAFADESLTTPILNGLVHHPDTLLIVAHDAHPLNLKLTQELNIPSIYLNDLDWFEIPKTSQVIVTVELDEPVLSGASKSQLAAVQKITDSASKILWVIGANLAGSQNPDMSISLGLSRTIMAEQPSLGFFVLDIDNPREGLDLTVSNLLSIINCDSKEHPDYEYLQKDGVLHVNRFVPNIEANEIFHKKKASSTDAIPIRDAGISKLSIREVGQMDSLYFHPSTAVRPVPGDHIEIQVKAVGINAKDLYTLSGKIETPQSTCSCEFSGVVVNVGSEALGFAIGDRVITCAPGYFGTYECVPAWACCKIHESESYSGMAAVPLAFMTAYYALRNLAQLQADESILIHSATGGVGIAAIQLAREIGAEIFATVGTSEKKAYLVDNFGIDPTHVLNSRDMSFKSQILGITNNKGIDVVLNSLTGERLHASLETCAKFGRFIEIGKRDILDAGNLNMRIFERSLTFSAFDLHELYQSPLKSHHQKFSRLLYDAMRAFRRLGAPAPAVFDVCNVTDAFRSFSNGTRIGKISVSFENSDSLIPYLSGKFTTRFSRNKSYLLVGCLGGLGRSIARYLFCQGARHFSFISRSGLQKAAAKRLVDDLERYGATVDIVRGNVQNFEVVRQAVDQLQFPLGGIVQAAMALGENLFTGMTHAQWSTVLGPKIQGSWNIHRAIAGKDDQLDFFLMTSSVSGSVCSPTESNYCAANCFLDHFAGYRRSLGLPATSVALGQVSGAGYIYEHADIEQKLARRGVAELTEDDMLLIIDITLSGSNDQQQRLTRSRAHVLTGMEPARVETIWDNGYKGSLEVFKTDPRLRILALGTPRFLEAQAGAHDHGLPLKIRDALAAEGNQPLHMAVFEMLAERLSNIILVPLEKITDNLRLSEVGMDSMLAAEYRTYIFRSFSVDIPFLSLMDSKSRMRDITEMICKALL